MTKGMSRILRGTNAEGKGSASIVRGGQHGEAVPYFPQSISTRDRTETKRVYESKNLDYTFACVCACGQ
jgi:hypothetical protein